MDCNVSPGVSMADTYLRLAERTYEKVLIREVQSLPSIPHSHAGDLPLTNQGYVEFVKTEVGNPVQYQVQSQNLTC